MGSKIVNKKTIRIPTWNKPYFMEFEATIVVYKDHEFAINPTGKGFCDFTYVPSGLGFNGQSNYKGTIKNAIENIKYREYQIGEKKFWDVIASQMLVEDNIKIAEKIDVDNVSRKNLCTKLKEAFKMHIPLCKFALMSNRIAIDVIEFEKQLERYHGYRLEDNVSISDFISSKWNPELAEITRSML